MPVIRIWPVMIIFLLCSVVATLGAQSAKLDPAHDARDALGAFKSLIGEWRGVGQPKRNSNRGAWSEKAEWVWDFKDDEPAIVYSVTKGKLLKKARVTWDARQSKLLLAATIADDSVREYSGTFQENRFVLESKTDDKGYVHRISMRLLNEKRTLVLFEKRRAASRSYLRVAEVGYTRAGTSLAVAGNGRRECVVTGGAGTMAVSYNGKTYYVCCTGCRQAFEDDPAGVIADYKARLAEKKTRGR